MVRKVATQCVAAAVTKKRDEAGDEGDDEDEVRSMIH